MTPASRVMVGRYEALWLRDAFFALDGGTMFNTVPRFLWQRKAPPDAQHRVRIGLNCLLLRGEGRVILVDAGVGNKLSANERRIYDVAAEPDLLRRLADAGVPPESVDTVVLTHLHLDHAGWLTARQGGRLVPTFPNARHVIQKAEWEAAHHPNELTRGSYRPEDFDPVADRGLTDLVEGAAVVAPSVTVTLTGAHCPGHQIVTVESGADALVCPSELLPTTWHLRASWLMSYDLDPIKVLEAKKELMRRAAAAGQILFLNHDPATAFGRLRATAEGEYAWEPIAEAR